MKCDGLILDIDGTVWNTTSIVAQAWNSVIEKKYPQIPLVTSEILKQQFGKTMKVISDNLFNLISESERKILIDECAKNEQIAIEKNTNDLTYEGVIDTLYTIHEKIPLFVVSNCQSGYIELVLKKNNIESLITDFECYGNNQKEKFENIELICKRNNLHFPVYVGDTQGDCDSCKKAEVPFIWAAYGFGKADSYEEKIEKFSDIISLLSFVPNLSEK